MLTITTNAAQVRDTLAQLEPKLARTATRRALNATLRNLRTELTQRLGKRIALKAADIKAALTDRKAGEQLEAVLEVAYSPVELKRFPHRQTRRGVSAGVLRGQGRKTIRSAFVVASVGSHVFKREGPARVMTRGRYAGKVRQPIRKLFGPSVRQQAAPLLDELVSSGWVSERLTANVRQEVDGLLKRRERQAAKASSGSGAA